MIVLFSININADEIAEILHSESHCRLGRTRWDCALRIHYCVLANNLIFVVTAGATLLPAAWTLFTGLLAARRSGAEDVEIWLKYVSRLRALNLLAVPAWWVICGVLSEPGVSHGATVNWPAWTVLILPLGIGIGLARFLSLLVGRKFDDRHWTLGDFLGSSAWNTLSSTVPLLFFAAGVDAIDDWRLTGILWLGAAGILSRFARAHLRMSSGFRPQLVKSGDLFKRSFAIAKQMNIPLKGVFVVPTGRGRLMNAHSAPGFIGMTDVCIHRMKGQQLDFAIAHELAHIQAKHGRRERQTVVCAFLGMATLSLASSHLPLILQCVFKFLAILVPVLLGYFISRRFEYAADGIALRFISDPESAIRALVALHLSSGGPARISRFHELLLTHPSLSKRIEAIVDAAHIPRERVAGVLRQFDIGNEPLAE